MQQEAKLRPAFLAVLTASALLVGGCTARWQPEARSPVELTQACPQRRAPLVPAFNDSGVRAVYHFVAEGASDDALGGLLRAAEAQSFRFMPITVNTNGRDTMFAHGPAVLWSQEQVDAEFKAACALGGGPVYLTHVRYNHADESAEAVRVR